LDATPFPHQALMAFAEDYDKRVARDSLYFGYSSKNLAQMRDELKENNIKYIVYSFRSLDYIKFYGCPLKHKEVLEEFVQQYGTLVYRNLLNGTVVYELK
jgi:hypothetical protein